MIVPTRGRVKTVDFLSETEYISRVGSFLNRKRGGEIMVKHTFKERQEAFHREILSFMSRRPGPFIDFYRPEIDRVVESVGLDGSFFECHLPKDGAVFVGTVSEVADGTLGSVLKEVTVRGEKLYPTDFSEDDGL
jgi:hypothetical protein